MNANLPDVYLLAECPHLSATSVLEVALETALSILRATYPNVSEGIDSDLFHSEEDAYADCVAQVIRTLLPILRAFRRAVESANRRSTAQEDSPESSTF
jgi:hypothetical protein